MPLLADIAAHGLERALESGRADHERRSIVQAWIAVGTWEESANTADAVGSPEIRELLAGSDSPDVRQHLAIIKLIDDIPPDGVFEIIAHPASAADAALEASKSAISGPDANGPAGWSARDKRPQVRPQATNVLALRSQAPRPAAALFGAGHDEAFRGGVHGPARWRAVRRNRHESPGGNSHPSASRPRRELEGILAPRARTFAPGSPDPTGAR